MKDVSTTKQFEEEIVGLEMAYWQAMKDGDPNAAMKLSDEPCIVTGASGVSNISRAQLGQMLKSGTWKLRDFSFSETTVRKLDDDVAVIAYKVVEHLEVDNAPVTVEASDASTWIKRDGQWLCAMHSESIVGDPFGRDRKQPARSS
jgi:hypothetical protein